MRLYTTGELASYFRVSENYILRLRKEGKLPHYKISNLRYRYDIEEIKKLFRGAK